MKKTIKNILSAKMIVTVAILIWLSLTWPGTAKVYAQEGIVPTGAFLGEYFDNADLTNLVLSRTDREINFNWGKESPHLSIGNDTFSVRWRGNFFFEDGQYEFFVKADDGVRVYVDGVLLIDRWEGQKNKESKVVKEMASGAHQVKVEYFENESNASIRAGWIILGLTDGVESVEPTYTPTPTPTVTPADNEEGGTSDESVPEVLVSNETDELPETGMTDYPLLVVGFLSLFGSYLFRQFRLIKLK